MTGETAGVPAGVPALALPMCVWDKIYKCDVLTELTSHSQLIVKILAPSNVSQRLGRKRWQTPPKQGGLLWGNNRRFYPYHRRLHQISGGECQQGGWQVRSGQTGDTLFPECRWGAGAVSLQKRSSTSMWTNSGALQKLSLKKTKNINCNTLVAI